MTDSSIPSSPVAGSPVSSPVASSGAALDSPAPAAAAGPDIVGRIQQRLDQLDSLQAMLADEQAPEIQSPDCELPPGFVLSIVIPVYNERATLRALLARVAQLPLDCQVVLVDDCSTDGTREMLERLAGASGVEVLYHSENQGKGAALRTGFAACKGDVVVVQDADLEYDPVDIPALLGPLVRDEADVVYGSRFLDGVQDPSWIHRLGNGLLTWASNRFTGLALTDMETCYKAFRREWLEKISLRQNRFGFEPEVTAKLARRGCRFAEVPIRYSARSYAEGKKIGVRDLFNAFYCIVRYGLGD